MTPAGIEPATFRFVARHLNHCATAFPLSVQYVISLLFASLYYFQITRLKFFFEFFVSFNLALYFCVFVLILLMCCPCPIFVQVYRPLPPGGNQIAANKYRTVITRSCPKTRHHHFLCQPFRALLNYVIQYTPIISGFGEYLVSENSRFFFFWVLGVGAVTKI